MKFTYFGHSCFLVEIDGCRVLFDPFISPNPLAADIDVDSIEADYVLITHGHEDHVADAEAILKRTGAKLIANFEIVTWYGAKGIENAQPLNHGGSCTTEFGKVKFVNAIHSSVLPDGTYGGNPGGFVIETNDGNFYVSGDTALTLDMKLIAESTKLTWAALCIGDTFTMGVGDAVRAASMVGVDYVIGTHYDTFPPIMLDHENAVGMFHNAGIRLRLPSIGETIEL
ncbi:metal-dependent hydrolase [Sulfuriroseicoccus oceanibius]|uniref:Metal-dependent hydrolase n=1 Tax=Sulfuriroseicoccus oceanibius TaxID=2707525 RepID=A0A6B3LED5_9BACT|nr:metal-dependent hydrolase [Sulfuriroseicoccus oceanibius]QQL45481.1 metal-dependent hydrolase [Sulfuriroseicoccus oceanibius]